MLGLTALSALASLHVQVLGLFGSEGILPLAPRLERLEMRSADPWLERPTLLYLTGASDAALERLCVAGSGCSRSA
jgi:hypothetical protein